MQMRNPTQDTVRIASLNNLTVKPGGVAEIPDEYCLPRKGAGQNGGFLPPIIAMLAPQLQPADEVAVPAYRANQHLADKVDDVPPPPAKTAADLQADGMAPAIAEMVASGNAASVPKVQPPKKGS